MELKGKVIFKSEVKSGISKNGNEWKVMDFVVEIPGQYPKKVCFQLMNNKIDSFRFNVGDEVNVKFDIEAREYQGRWFNSIIAWEIAVTQASAPQPITPQAQPTEPAKNDDDLPF